MKKIEIFVLLIFSIILCKNLFSENFDFSKLTLNGKFLSISEKKYLGLSEKTSKFKIYQIKSKFKVIEFVNIYCFACQKQAPEFNKFFLNINKKNVKFIGIALGNCKFEVEDFKKKFKIKFPIIPDPKYEIYEKIGGTRTPFTIVLKNNKLIYAHLGLIENYSPLYEAISGKNFQKKIVYHERKFKTIKLNDNLIIEKIKSKLKKIKDVKKFKNYYKVFADNKIFFVVPVTSQSVCNICHPLQFIYIVTSNGKIYDIIPIYLTKRFNKKLTEKEFDKIRVKLIGKNILKPIIFNKKVDAITSATITSSMIFYFINQAKKILPLSSTK